MPAALAADFLFTATSFAEGNEFIQYVDPEAGADENDGSEATPKATIDAAYAALVGVVGEDDRGTILLSAGEHVVTGSSHIIPVTYSTSPNIWFLDLEIPVTIKPMPGLSLGDVAVIPNSSKASRSIFNLAHDGVVLESLRITNGNIGSSYNFYGIVGGGIADMSGGMITNCIIENNIGSHKGGGVAMHGGKILNSIIRENRTKNSVNHAKVGGIYIYGTDDVLVQDCVISNNHAQTETGGIYMEGNPKAIVRRCLITHNDRPGGYNQGLGMGVWMNNGLVEDCQIIENGIKEVAPENGGGVYMSGGGILNNCLVAGNKCAKNGGGIYMTGGAEKVLNCTVVNNYSEQTAYGGLYLAGQWQGTVINSIFYNNNPGGDESNIYRNFGCGNANAGTFIDYNCIVPKEALDYLNYKGEHNVFSAPQLLSLDSPLDVTPLISSPCVDAGGTTNEFLMAKHPQWGYWPFPADKREEAPIKNINWNTDINGNSRGEKGSPASFEARPDIGCMEAPSFMNGPLTVSFSRNIERTQQDLPYGESDVTKAPAIEVVFTPSAGGSGCDSEGLRFYWYKTILGETEFLGMTTAQEPELIAEFTVGTYDITLYATNTAATPNVGAEPFTTPSAVKISAPWAYVVEPGTPGNTPTPPYYTWETAANDIPSAINQLAPELGTLRSKVIVDDGDYYVSGEFMTILADIDIISLNGPEKTTIHATNNREGLKYWRILTLNNPSAVISGFSFTDGDTSRVSNSTFGTAGLTIYAGTVTNCWFYGNRGYRDNAGAFSLVKGLVTDCRIFNNKSVYDWNYGGDNYGRAAAFEITGAGTVANCIITNNESYAGGTVRIANSAAVVTNCYIAGNYGGVACASGVDISSGLIVDCVIKGNYQHNSSKQVSNENYQGGGVRISGGTMRQCLVCENQLTKRPQNGQALYITGGTVESCTISGNGIESGAGNAVYATGGTFLNTIIDGNNVETNFYSTKAAPAITYCCYPEAVPTEENHNIAGTRLTKKYFLRKSSPCRRAGTLSPWMVGAQDLTANTFLDYEPQTRLRESYPNQPDIGCFASHEPLASMFFLR